MSERKWWEIEDLQESEQARIHAEEKKRDAGPHVDWSDPSTWPPYCIVCDYDFKGPMRSARQVHAEHLAGTPRRPMYTNLDPEHTVAFCSPGCFAEWSRRGHEIRQTQRFLRREDRIPAGARQGKTYR